MSMRIDNNNKYEEVRDCIDQRYVKFARECGIEPILVSNIMGINLNSLIHIIKPDGIILTGGNDIGEYKSRDETEMRLLNFAEKNQKPVFGICRGMQMLSYYYNGSMRKLRNHAGTNHQIHYVDERGKIKSREVNSYHNWTIKSLPEMYEIVAKCQNDSIESIRHKQLNWEGCMWHPEREKCYNELDINRIKDLFKL